MLELAHVCQNIMKNATLGRLCKHTIFLLVLFIILFNAMHGHFT